MRLEDKAKRVQEIINKISDGGSLFEDPQFTPSDLYVIWEVLKSAEYTWTRQAHFRDVSKLQRAQRRIKHGPAGKGYERAVAYVAAHELREE